MVRLWIEKQPRRGVERWRGGSGSRPPGLLFSPPLRSSRVLVPARGRETEGEGGGVEWSAGEGRGALWNPSERCGLGWALHGERACPKMVIIGPSLAAVGKLLSPPPTPTPTHPRPSFFLAQAASLRVFAASWIMSRHPGRYRALLLLLLPPSPSQERFGSTWHSSHPSQTLPRVTPPTHIRLLSLMPPPQPTPPQALFVSPSPAGR